jgi:hypothetical protein
MFATKPARAASKNTKTRLGSSDRIEPGKVKCERKYTEIEMYLKKDREKMCEANRQKKNVETIRKTKKKTVDIERGICLFYLR